MQEGQGCALLAGQETRDHSQKDVYTQRFWIPQIMCETRGMSYDLREAAKHVVHDYAWLVAAGTDTGRVMPGRTNHYAERTFLVHCRAFAGFFSSGTDHRDMYARHFVANPRSPQLRAWEKWHKHIDRQLMHLTKARVKNKRPWTGADNELILESFRKTWGEFHAEIKPTMKPTFDIELRAMQKQMPDVSLS
jgi:hypothetical protein